MRPIRPRASVRDICVIPRRQPRHCIPTLSIPTNQADARPREQLARVERMIHPAFIFRQHQAIRPIRREFLDTHRTIAARREECRRAPARARDDRHRGRASSRLASLSLQSQSAACARGSSRRWAVDERWWRECSAPRCFGSSPGERSSDLERRDSRWDQGAWAQYAESKDRDEVQSKTDADSAAEAALVERTTAILHYVVLLVFCPGNSLTKSCEFLEDGVGGSGPHEGA
jgi:hypothetical protein